MLSHEAWTAFRLDGCCLSSGITNCCQLQCAAGSEAAGQRTVTLSVSSSRVSLNTPETPTEATQHSMRALYIHSIDLHSMHSAAQQTTAHQTQVHQHAKLAFIALTASSSNATIQHSMRMTIFLCVHTAGSLRCVGPAMAS